MSNTPDPPTLKEGERTPHDRHLFGLLREIRGAAQYLQKLIEETLDQASKLEGTARTALMSRALGEGMLTRIDDTMTLSLYAIHQLFSVDVEEQEWCSDHIQMVRLNWLQVCDAWPQATLSFDEQRRGLIEAQPCLDKIIYHCATLTLTPRMNDTLKNLRVGQPLDWDFSYAWELPRDPGLRHQLLLEIAQEAGVLESVVVDVEQRVI